MMRIIIFFIASLWHFSLYAKAVEITLWHSLAGHLGSELRKLTDDFNHSQDNYLIKPIYKGDYVESLTSFAAAFWAKKPPALIQVFEVGTGTMLSPKGIIKPVDELMMEQGLTLPKASFFPALLARYSEKGHLMAMPLNTSIPVMFYNADALENLGVTEANFPATWDALRVLVAALNRSGFACGYTSAYPSWILMESYVALQGLSKVNVQKKETAYNNPLIIGHLERLLRWQKLHYFEYGGRGDDATNLFTSGYCALMSQSSGGFNSLKAVAPFRVGMAALPVEGGKLSRFDALTGGAALWVSTGQTPQIYQGVAAFFSYLAQPAVQLQWHQNTGYLPLGLYGIYESIAQTSVHPSLALAQRELSHHSKSEYLPRPGAENLIRSIHDEALEAIFSGMKNPREAMEDAEVRSRHAQLRFLRNTRESKSSG